MNGRYLTLGLVGALAVGTALGRRGSRASAETLYHGGTEEVRAPRAGIFLTPDLQTASTYARYGPNQSKRIPQDGVVSSYSLDPKASVQTFRSFADAYAHYGVRSSQALARTAVQRREADVVAVYDERILVHPSVVNWIGSEPVAGEGSRATNLPSNPAFRRWFGESKVVDAEGRPLVVYHGTATPTFEAFSFHHGINAPVPNAAYFGDNPAVANDAAGYGSGRAIYPVYLRMLRPLVIDAQGAHAIHLTERVVSALSRGRYDGVILENVREYFSEAPSTTYAVFDPTQIKSATGNRGTFDPDDPRISFNRSAPTEAALRTLRAAMVKAARADTAYAPAQWKRAKDPLTGHCYAAAHLVQDRFGGEIVKGTVRGQAHAWNRLPGGREVDLTGSQYGGDGMRPLVKGEGVAASRSTNPRFARFAARVDAQLGRR